MTTTLAAPKLATTPDAVLYRADHPAGPHVLEALERRGLDATPVRLDAGETLPDAHTLAVAVICGSGAPEEQVIDWVRDADGAGLPILALGTAAHELAIALGGSVTAGARTRRGWINVASREPDLVPAGPWLTWEGALIGLPATGRVIADDHTGPQAFAVGPHLGIQLHPYAAAASVRAWSSVSEAVLDSQGLLEAASRDYAASVGAADRLVNGFLESALGTAA